MGVTLAFTVPGKLLGFRFYKENGDIFQVNAAIYDNSLFFFRATKAFYPATYAGPTGWQQAWICPQWRVDTTLEYRMIFGCFSYYYRNNGALSSPVTHNGIQFRNSFTSTVISTIAVPPTTNTNANAIDVLFQPD